MVALVRASYHELSARHPGSDAALSLSKSALQRLRWIHPGGMADRAAQRKDKFSAPETSAQLLS
jgi:hypothetical protein